MANPILTVRDLRTALLAIGSEHNDVPVTVWLPGSAIDLGSMMGIREHGLHGQPKHRQLLIEDNVRPGSALDDVS